MSYARGRGDFEGRRGTQQLAWLKTLVEGGLHEFIMSDPAVRAEQAEVVQLVAAGTLSPAGGARRLLAKIARR